MQIRAIRRTSRYGSIVTTYEDTSPFQKLDKMKEDIRQTREDIWQTRNDAKEIKEMLLRLNEELFPSTKTGKQAPKLRIVK